ncbi:MAG: phytanoyl-CoA dioxygenase family protein [Microthrixaceae bacterium]
MHFIDNNLQQQFQQYGFVKFPLLLPHEVTQLQELWEMVRPPEIEGIYSNIHDQPQEINTLVDQQITELFALHLPALMGDAWLGGATFLVKGAGPNSASTPHQDWCNVDERRALSATLWCPLVDVDEHNGALQVLPGTHRLPPTVRSLDTPSVYLDFDDRLEPWLTCVPAKAGEGVLYAHNLFHGSKPNLSGDVRVAAVSGVLPVGVTHLHYRRDPDRTGSFETYEVERDFFLSGIPEMANGRVPDSAHYRSTGPHRDEPLTFDEIVAAVVAAR